MSGRIQSLKKCRMVRGVLLFMLMVLCASPCLATRTICDQDGNCVDPPAPPPNFGFNPQHPIAPGGGWGPVFALWDQEPYRNSDMGPLGVVLSTGEFQITVTDFEIPGRGFPFQLSRTYRSRRDGERSVLGHNWQLSYDEYLTPGIYPVNGSHCDAVQWRMGNGWTDVWVDQCDLGLGWKAFVGFFGRIRPLGANLGYQIRHANGTVKTFSQQARNSENQIIWALTRIEDRNGNALTLHHSQKGIDTVTDTLGRTITFSYNEDGRLASVTDFMGRSVVYQYDVRGDLVAVRSPVVIGTPNGNDFPSGKTTTYHYLGADGCSEEPLKHNLGSITDGKGQAFLTNVYFSASDPLCGAPGQPVDAVATQAYGGGTPPPTLSYAYSPLSAWQSPAANVVTTQTTVTDRNGNVQVHRFNTQGNPLSIEYRTNRGVRTLAGADEIDYLETNTYVDNGGGDQPMLVSRHTQSGGFSVDSAGNLVPYAGGMTEEYVYYDQQGFSANPDLFQKGNVLQLVRTPGPRGAPAGQEQLVTTCTYEPLFNQPLTITDPRGHVTKMTYDYQEGTYAQLTGGTVPASVDPAWWPNSNVSQFMAIAGNSNLGEINGDTYHRNGNLIKVSEGVATDPAGMPNTPGPGDEIATYTAYNDFGLPVRSRDAEYNETVFRYFAENDPDGDLAVTPAPTDSRALSGATGSAGGGFLKEKVLDAAPTMPLPPGVTGNPRESGQNPPVQSILLSFTYDPVGNIKTTTDGRGVRTDYSVNALNQIVKIVHAAAKALGSDLQAFGYLEQFRYDANNNIIQHRTEQRDDIPQAIPGAGAYRWVTKDIAYDSLDRKTSETITTQDSPVISLTTSYAYDNNGNLRKTIFPAGNAILRFYDERDLLYREVALKNTSTDPADMSYSPGVDSVTQYDYDGSGNLIQLTDPEGHVARTGYDGYGRKVVGFDPAYQKSTFAYDAVGNILTQVSYGSLGGETPTPSTPPGWDYPELSRQNFYYDELGRRRRSDFRFFKYVGTALTPLTSDFNAGLTATPPGEPLPGVGDGWVTNLVRYDRLGRIVQTVDDNGHATETRYDGLGRRIKILRNVALPFTFDPMNPLNYRNAVDYAYDPDGNVTQITETEYGADRTGASPRLLPGQQHLSTFKYDSMNRQIEAKLVGRVGASPINLTTTTVHDSRGNRIQVTDPAGGRTKSFYDGLNRLTKTEAGWSWNGAVESVPANMINAANPDGKITTIYSYDANSRLAAIKDDNNRFTRFLYDNLNRQTRVTYPDGTFRQVTYNRDSLAASWAHFSNTGYWLSASTQFDRLHRVTQKDVHNAGAPQFAGSMRQIFQYDGLGRITLAQDDADASDGFVDSEVALSYNSAGKVLSEVQSWRDNASGQLLTGINAVTSTYDGTGFRTSVTYPGGRRVAFLADELGRSERIVDSYTGAVKYDFIGGGRVLSRTYPNGTKLTMLSGPTDNVGVGYDNARRLVDFANKLSSNGADLARFAYGYDPAGNRTFERRVHETSGASWKGETYGYDGVYRVINRKEGDLNASGVLQGTPRINQDFILDGLGNWKSHRKNSLTYNQTINTLNQYTAFNGPQGQSALNYDFVGNLTNESLAAGDRQYGYDFLNRLVTFLDVANNLTTYRYDALGRRISKGFNGLTDARYVYDGDRLIEERDGTNAMVTSYVYGPGSDEVLTRRRWSGGIPADLFYHTNALGSVTAVTSSTGLVVERYKYDAYGQVTFLSPTFTPLISSTVYNNILFTGRYYDTESQLYYYRARTYHPYLGRFLQRDPLGETASLNLYNYVFNNPVNDADPTGMMSGLMAQEYAETRGASESAYRQRMAQDDASAQKAEEAMRQLHGYTAMEDRFSAGIQQRENAHWGTWYAKRQARRNDELKQQIQTSVQDSWKVLNQKGISTPVGVAVMIYGLGQTPDDPKNETDLDQRAAALRDNGYIVIEFESDTLAQVGKASEPSETGIGILSQAVSEITVNGSMGGPIEITGFSRGGGGAIQLANALTGSGIAGSRISLDLVDPYMGADSHTLNDPNVSVAVEKAMGYHATNLAVNIGTFFIGIEHRSVSQRSALGGYQKRTPTLFDIPHTRMDSCVSRGGALSGC